MRIFEDQMVSKEGPRPNMKVETLNFDHKETLFETRAAALEWLKFNGILVSYIGNAYRIFKLEFHLIKKRFDLQFYYFLFSSSLSSLKTLKKKVQNGSCWCDFYCILFSFQRPPSCTVDFDL